MLFYSIDKIGYIVPFRKVLTIDLTLFQWKKKTEKQRAVIKFKAAARIARVTHELNTTVRSTNVTDIIEELDETVE